MFGDPSVQNKFADWNTIKFDVTASNPEQMAWLAERNVFGPPAIFFFDSKGAEIAQQRIVGATGLEHFQSVMTQLQ